jgi:trehalose 6-phosphate synthase/phosphatase
MSSEQLTPENIPGGQPDPVLVGPGVRVLGEEAYTMASTATPTPGAEKGQPLFPGAPSYFSNTPGAEGLSGSSDATPITPAEAAKDARSGNELLRRLSLRDTPKVLEADLRQQHPGLRLSGRIISAAFCIPYKVYYRPGSQWVSLYLFPGLLPRLSTGGVHVTDRLTSW